MSDTTDSTTGADGCDQFVDDDRDETLLMHKGTELETVSTTDVNLTDPEYTMQMNRFFRCQYDNMLSKFPESLKIFYVDSGYVSDQETVFGKCRNEEKCNFQPSRWNISSENESASMSKFPESLKIISTDLEYVSYRERAIDTEMLENKLDVVQGEFGELNQFKCSDAAHRCRMPGLTGPEEDKRELMTPTSISLKTRNNAIDDNIGHSDCEIDRADLEVLEGMKIGSIVPEVGCLAFPDGSNVIVFN